MPGKATMMTELRISIKSDIGVMAKLTLPLKQNSINIECFCAYEMDDKAIFYLMTNNNPKDRNYYTSMNIKSFFTLLSFYKDKQDMQEIALRNASK